MERLGDKLAAGTFVVTAEVDPPRGVDAAPLAERVRRLAGLVDAVNVTDCPRANVRMSSIVAAHLIERSLALETIFHLTCRDRNVIGLQADLLGAAALGLRNLLVLAGDPPPDGQRGVYEVDAVGLIRLVAALNGGCTAAGKPLEHGPTSFRVAVAANPAAPDRQREVSRLGEKVAAGGDFVQTQPVFDPDTAEGFAAALAAAGVRAPVLYGIMPLRDLDFARRVSAIPGVRVPDWALRRLERGGPEEGRRMAAELAADLAAWAAGIHVFPMGDLAVVEAVVAAAAEARRRGRRAVARGG